MPPISEFADHIKRVQRSEFSSSSSHHQTEHWQLLRQSRTMERDLIIITALHVFLAVCSAQIISDRPCPHVNYVSRTRFIHFARVSLSLNRQEINPNFTWLLNYFIINVGAVQVYSNIWWNHHLSPIYKTTMLKVAKWELEFDPSFQWLYNMFEGVASLSTRKNTFHKQQWIPMVQLTRKIIIDTPMVQKALYILDQN